MYSDRAQRAICFFENEFGKKIHNNHKFSIETQIAFIIIAFCFGGRLILSS